MPARTLLVLIVALATHPATAQNLLTTPEFDAAGDVANWPDPFPDPGTTISWEATLDVDGSPSSGSLKLENSISNGSNDGPQQCVDTGPGTYEVEGWVYNPTQSPQPTPTLLMLFFSSPGCSGSIGNDQMSGTFALDVWTLHAEMIDVPATTASIGFRPLSGGTVDPTVTTVYWDALYLPEPRVSAGWLAGAAMLAALARRRSAL